VTRHEKQDPRRTTSNRSIATSVSHRDNPRRLLAPKRFVQLPYELIRHRAKHEKHEDQERENETPDGAIFGIVIVPLVASPVVVGFAVRAAAAKALLL
jgi:hypothetical protein